MSQANAILAHLEGGPITDNDARELYRCNRLAARINDLRKRGHQIRTDMEPHRGGRHARYSLEPRQAEMW